MHVHTNGLAQGMFCHRGKSQLFIHEQAQRAFDLLPCLLLLPLTDKKHEFCFPCNILK